MVDDPKWLSDLVDVRASDIQPRRLPKAEVILPDDLGDFSQPAGDPAAQALVQVFLRATRGGPVSDEPCHMAPRLRVPGVRSGYRLMLEVIRHDADLRQAGLRWLLRHRWKPSYRRAYYSLCLWRDGQDPHLERDAHCETPVSARAILRLIAANKRVAAEPRTEARRLLGRDFND